MVDQKIVDEISQKYSVIKKANTEVHNKKEYRVQKILLYREYMDTHKEELIAFFSSMRNCYLYAFYILCPAPIDCSECRKTLMYDTIQNEVNHID